MSGLTWCSTCGAQVTACEGRRMRCRRSAQHERCRKPSAKAEHLEQQLGAWLCSAFVLPANLKVKVAALVRAKARGSGTAQSAERAATLRTAIKRITDAYTWGALGEADYREKLRELKDQLERVDAAPDERRMMTAIKLAQDLAATWERARPERRKQLIAALFETVKVARGRIVSVQPKTAVMPLVAVTMTEADIVVEGLDELASYAIVSA